MNLLPISLLTVYTTMIVVLIWAKFRFFKITSTTSRLSSYFYDPIVIVHIIITYYFFFTKNSIDPIRGVLAVTFCISGIALFWWTIVTAKHLGYAFSDNVGKIITSGPYAWIRHPFYLSYIFVWLTSTLLFNSLYLWITLTYLVAFYFTSAKSEEKVILKSDYSREYQEYSQNVGMFLPRITLWKI